MCLFGDNEDDLNEIFENDEQKSNKKIIEVCFMQDRLTINHKNKKKRKTKFEREKNNSREEGECRII